MSNKNETMDKDQIIYEPSYVEKGIVKLDDAQNILAEIAAEIESGLAKINSSGYERGIPYIEKGNIIALAIEQLKSIINTIISKIEEYSSGNNILSDAAEFIANLKTALKYGIFNKDTDGMDNSTESGVSPKWSSDYLKAAVGSLYYYAQDGRYTKETWCDLDPSNLAKLMKKQGIDLDFWIREDGVYMYGDYVMVAADIPHMDGTEQDAEYRKGDLVETSLGTGMVVDLCGMAEMVRKGQLAGTKEADVEVWYDIYTAWHDGGQYQHIAYCEDPGCTESYHQTAKKTMIQTKSV